MKTLALKFSISGLGVVLSAIAGLILSKIIAIKYGPSYLGEFAIFRQFFQVLVVFITFGNGFSLIQGLSNTDNKRRFLSSALKYYFGMYLVIIFFIYGLSFISLPLINGQYFSSLSSIILPVILFFTLLFSFQRFSIAGQGLTFKSSISQSFPYILMLIGISFIHLIDRLFLFAYLLSFIFIILIHTKSLCPSKDLIVVAERDKDFEKTSLSTFITGVSGLSTFLIIKIVIKKYFNTETVGIFEASWNLAIYASMVLLNGLSLFYLPRLSSNNNDLKLVEHTLIFIVTSAVALCIFFAVFSEQIIPIFYSSQFIESIKLLKIISFGELLRALSWFFVFSFIALKQRKKYILIDLISNLSFVTIALYLAQNKYDIYHIGKSYIIYQQVYLLLCLIKSPFNSKLLLRYKLIPYVILIFSFLGYFL